VAYNPTGGSIASGSKDCTIRLWTPSVVGLYTPKVLKAHSACVRSVEFSENGESLVSASDDKTIKLWSARDGKFLSTLTGHTNWVKCASFSPESNAAVSASDDKTVRLW
jgi:centriolar protein POC1